MPYRSYTAVRLVNGRTHSEHIEIDPDGEAIIVAGTRVDETMEWGDIKVLVNRNRFTIFKRQYDGSGRHQFGYQCIAILERQWCNGVYGTYGWSWWQFMPSIKLGRKPKRSKPVQGVCYALLALALTGLSFAGLWGLLFFAIPVAAWSLAAFSGDTGVLFDEDLPTP